jgi:aspartyl protease family protein
MRDDRGCIWHLARLIVRPRVSAGVRADASTGAGADTTASALANARARVASIFAAAVFALFATPAALAQGVNVVGVFPGKAVLSINGSQPRTLSVGQTVDGVKLLGVEDGRATVLVEGKRTTLAIGQAYSAAPTAAKATESGGQVTLTADSKGHFSTTALLNGKSVIVLVDSGASVIALDQSTARRIGLDYEKKPMGLVQTANGTVPVWQVKLDSVKVGDITLFQVDAVVTGGAGIGITLLGNSFLSRTDMKQEGGRLTLVKRF